MYLMWEEKKKKKRKGKQCPRPSNQEKGGKKCRGMHEIHTYETHLRNSKWIVI